MMRATIHMKFLITVGILLFSGASLFSAVPNLAQLKTAAEAGDAKAQFEYGKRVSDAREKFGWFLRSAQQGYSLAQDAVAQSCAQEYSSDPRKKQSSNRDAVRWASRAAYQGLADVQMKLGRYYDRGVGVSKNPIAAYMWMQIAVNSTGGEKSGLVGSLYRLERDNLITRISSEQIAEGMRLAAQFKPANYAPKMNPVEADIVFGQLKLTAVYETGGRRSAVLSGVRFGVGDAKDIAVDGSSFRFTCRAVESKSAQFELTGGGQVVTFNLGK